MLGAKFNLNYMLMGKKYLVCAWGFDGFFMQTYNDKSTAQYKYGRLVAGKGYEDVYFSEVSKHWSYGKKKAD